MTEGERLAELSVAVRESTVKRLKRVPDGAENWAPTGQSMSFADLAQHILDADEWLFEALRVGGLPAMDGEVGRVKIGDRAEFVRLIESLEEIGTRRRELLERLTEDQLGRKIPDERYGGPVTVWWVVVRGNLDHEIHHRGEINTYLKMARRDQ